MKNKLSDLNNHLFSSLERLSEEELQGDKLTEELRRASAIAETAHAIIDNAKLAFDAAKALHECKIGTMPGMISGETNEVHS